MNPIVAMESEDEVFTYQPITLLKQVENGIKAVPDESTTTITERMHTTQTSEKESSGNNLTDSHKKVFIGDFTYKEKHAVESMIHQLEKELLKSKYYKQQ